MKKILFVFFIFIGFVVAKDITLDYLKSQPAGISRDFYIWLFLQQDIKPKEAKEAYDLAYKKNAKLFGLLYKKGDNKTLSRKTICQRMELSKLIKQDSSCIASALTLKNAEKLDKNTLISLSKKIKEQNKTLSRNLAIMASTNPFGELIKGSPENFGNFYFGVSAKYRAKLNKEIPTATLVKYIQSKNATFFRAMKHAIINQGMVNLHASFLNLKVSDVAQFLDSEDLFYLGLNAIKYGDTKDALEYFKLSSKSAKYKINKNRALFWSYMASKDMKYLQELSLSDSVDIYTIASLEITGKNPQYEIHYDVSTNDTKASWDITDPFKWVSIRDSKNKQKSIQAVNHSNTKAHYLWLNKQKGIEYFLMPYKDVFGKYSSDKQALLYALGRQESLFIPTAISTSYALGLMQLMPFNVVAISKELNESDKVGYLDMFNPAINVRYAEYFTRPLIREFNNHPLFISYAYNGGPGFTRRFLANNDVFKKSNPLDPWYSLEVIPYEETRLYGKKVLANYIIYQKAFGKELKVNDILKKTLR